MELTGTRPDLKLYYSFPGTGAVISKKKRARRLFCVLSDPFCIKRGACYLSNNRHQLGSAVCLPLVHWGAAWQSATLSISPSAFKKGKCKYCQEMLPTMLAYSTAERHSARWLNLHGSVFAYFFAFGEEMHTQTCILQKCQSRQTSS